MYDYRLANTKIYFFLREKAKHPNFMVCYMLILLDQTTHPKKFYIKYIKYPLKKIWQGYNKTIGRFPIYYEQPPVQRDTKTDIENKEKQPVWK